MTKTTTALAVLLAAGCAAKPADGGATAATAVTATTPTAVTPTAATPAGAPMEPSAEPAENDAPPAKKYDCGAKGQTPCPMQGWMKRVMGPASSSGDAPKLAEALVYVAKRPPPGLAGWVEMANEGAARAKAGDIEGAKASCKKCHDRHKDTYKATMRDRPW